MYPLYMTWNSYSAGSLSFGFALSFALFYKGSNVKYDSLLVVPVSIVSSDLLSNLSF